MIGKYYQLRTIGCKEGVREFSIFVSYVRQQDLALELSAGPQPVACSCKVTLPGQVSYSPALPRPQTTCCNRG
eukprot:6362348-Amphidinium_carterae.1